MVFMIVLLSILLVSQLLTLVLDMIEGPSVKHNRYQIITEGDPRKKKKTEAKSVRYFGTKEYFNFLVPVAISAFLFSVLFFRSFNMAILVTLGSTFYPGFLIKQKKAKEKKTLNYQFRDALLAINNSMKAGSSLNGAIGSAALDMRKIYSKSKSKPIVEEFDFTLKDLEIGVPVEDALKNLKKRCDLEDINDFVNIALITKKQGGNLVETIERLTGTITDRIQIENEIGTLVASKKMEAKMLTFSPIFLVILLSFMSPDYMSPLYDTMIGQIMMIVGVLLLVLNYFIGKKIIEIDI